MEILKIVTVFVITSSFSTASNVTTLHLQRHHRHDGSLEGLGKHLRSVRSLKKITIKDFQDMYYYAEIKIGTPGQCVLVQFDTGSCDLWVPSSSMCGSKKSYCQQHKTYSHNASSSYEKVGKKFSISYGSGSVSGHHSKDKISVGTLQLSCHEFGEATSVNEVTASHKYDGIFGMAYPSLSNLGTDPPFVAMYKQGVLDKHVFAFYLRKQGPGWSASGNAELVLGGVDSAHYKGDFTFASVTKREHWNIKIDSLKMGSKQIFSSYNAIVDSGTSFLYGPKKAIEAINTALNGTYEDVYLYVDCSNVSKYPNISYVINGKSFTLHPSDYIFKVHEERRCISSFIGFYDMSFFILGDVFMRKYYTQFDMGNNRIGFALAK